MILFDQRKGEVDGRGNPGGTEHGAIANEDTIRLDPDVGKVGRQAFGILPVRCRAASRQQPGLRQQEGARAGRAVAPRTQRLLAQPPYDVVARTGGKAIGSDDDQRVTGLDRIGDPRVGDIGYARSTFLGDALLVTSRTR